MNAMEPPPHRHDANASCGQQRLQRLEKPAGGTGQFPGPDQNQNKKLSASSGPHD
jgi:hypothetical protein